MPSGKCIVTDAGPPACIPADRHFRVPQGRLWVQSRATPPRGQWDSLERPHGVANGSKPAPGGLADSWEMRKLGEIGAWPDPGAGLRPAIPVKLQAGIDAGVNRRGNAQRLAEPDDGAVERIELQGLLLLKIQSHGGPKVRRRFLCKGQ